MLSKIKRQFFSGLIIFVPLSLTVYCFRLFFHLTSQALLPILVQQKVIQIHQSFVRPISFILTITLIWFLGVVASNYFGKHLVSWLERGIHRIPFFRGLYEAIQKVTEAFFGLNPIYQSAVLVEYPRKGVYTFGFVTSEISGAVFGKTEAHYCVFVPTVPNPTSGILLYVPMSEVFPVNLTIEEVAKILVSHGFSKIPEGALKPR